MRHLATIVLLVSLSALSVRGARKERSSEPQFSYVGSSYNVAWSYVVDCPRDTLLDIFFDPEHVRACMGRSNLTILVADSSAFRNRIDYKYLYFISTLRITFDRVLDTALGEVRFTMAASSVSGSGIVPTVNASRGHYRVWPDSGGMRVEYWQETTLDRELNDFYMHFIRNDTRRVLKNQEKYSRVRGAVR